MDKPVAIRPASQNTTRTNLFRRVAENPVILKELRGRMRGRRAFIILTIYLVIVSLLVGGVYTYLAAQQSNSYYYWEPSSRQNFGKTIFGSVVLFEFLLIGFIGPALTAGAITSERERQTFDLLRTTLLSARALVYGKLSSACMYLLLLVFAALPIEALAFILGGVGMEEILVSSLMLVVNIVFFCALGLLCSSFTKRTLTATISCYSVILLSLLMFGLTFYALIQYMSTSYASPYFAQINIITWLFCSTNSLLAGLFSELLLIENHIPFYGLFSFGSNVNVYVFSPWVLHVALCVIFSIMMIFASILFVRRPDR